MKNDKSDTTHFGFAQIPRADKAGKVATVFASVAPSYDVMNDFMSFGLHRLWKRIAINYCLLYPNSQVLDVAGGSGDLSLRMAPFLGERGKILLLDINSAMLQVARNRILDQGLSDIISLIQADAEHLPFGNQQFDRIIIGFGLRNVTNKEDALTSMYRVLKPGGRLIILEFSTPQLPGLQQIYDLYSFNCLPLLGRWIAKDADSYQYLAESIRMHPDQQSLKQMITAAGFEQAEYHNLMGGIVAIHIGIKH